MIRFMNRPDRESGSRELGVEWEPSISNANFILTKDQQCRIKFQDQMLFFPHASSDVTREVCVC